MLDRGEQLSKYSFPKLDAAFFASLMRGAMAGLILAAIVWLVSGLVRRFMEARDPFADGALARNPTSERR
jgi:hypothetical protein